MVVTTGELTTVVVLMPGAVYVVVLELNGISPSPSRVDRLAVGRSASGSVKPVTIPSSALVVVVIVGDLLVNDAGIRGTGGGVHAPSPLEPFLPGSGERALASDGRTRGLINSGDELVSKPVWVAEGDLGLRRP